MYHTPNNFQLFYNLKPSLLQIHYKLMMLCVELARLFTLLTCLDQLDNLLILKKTLGQVEVDLINSELFRSMGLLLLLMYTPILRLGNIKLSARHILNSPLITSQILCSSRLKFSALLTFVCFLLVLGWYGSIHK